MSYSFQVRAATKSEAKDKVAAKFKEVVAAQACHERDREPALAAANAMIDLLDDTAAEDREVSVMMSGYLSGRWVVSDVSSVTATSVSVQTAWMSKEAA